MVIDAEMIAPTGKIAAVMMVVDEGVVMVVAKARKIVVRSSDMTVVMITVVMMGDVSVDMVMSPLPLWM
jgi:hypothetical protein